MADNPAGGRDTAPRPPGARRAPAEPWPASKPGALLEPLAYYEAVPYLLVVESVERGGEWLRRAEYPELPGCAAEASSATEAIEQLEQARVRRVRELWDRGEPIPVPRPPLRDA